MTLLAMNLVLTQHQMQLYGRPNPQVCLGAIDDGCPLIIVDLKQHDCPIIYCSEAFTYLTGYSKQEILGRNCRFLQTPPNRVPRASREQKEAIRQMRHAVKHNQECQLTVTNYRKDGTKFLNYLTMIPVCWNSLDGLPNYSVGLQIEVDE